MVNIPTALDVGGNFMRTLTFTYLLCILTTYSYGQKNKLLSGDTAFWYKLQYEKEETLGLKHLLESNDSFHFRFWTDKQTVDIWTTNGTYYDAVVTSYTNSYDPYDEEKKTRKTSVTYQSQFRFDTSTARQAFELTKSINIIPTDKLIKNWKQGFDGIEYIFEVTTPLSYDFKTYWTPTAQDSNLIEAKVIQKFVITLDSLLEMYHKYQNFFATLKPATYINGGPMITTKLTPKQIAYYKKTKPYRDYLASISDTLNQYLSDTLTKIFMKLGEPKCYDQFFLKFSPTNKLLKITTNSKFTDKADKHEFIKCKEMIMGAFKNVRVDFVHSQVDYWKELSFWDGKVNIYQ
jgi:hypothetical protein